MTTCSACGFEMAADRRFCTNCGAAALRRSCPQCGAPAAHEERFCGDCGYALSPGAFGRTPTSSDRNIDEKGPSSVRHLLGERKQVTVFFADVQGSMDLAEALDPEDWAEVMDRFFQILSDGVTRFGGTVDKFTGDGVMALFGAPVAQEDHARRACHAALHLSAATAAYAADLNRTKGIDLHARLGLNSGEVVVGGIGEAGQIGYTALGHTVGLAQRMESLAEPGHIFLTEHTARLVRSHFRLRDVGRVEVKGASEPIGVFDLEAALGRSPGVGSTAFVGRAGELDALEAALSRAEAGQAQVVGIVGDAGVGKSRLCEELAQRAATKAITVHRAGGVSHARDVPLLPILELLRGYFGVSEADLPAEARHKVAGRVLALDAVLDEALPLLLDFLGIPDPERSAPKLSPEVRMSHVLAALRRVFQRRSRRETLVLLFEDLHSFDRQSEAFLERLIPLFLATRTLVLTTFRPEWLPPWGGHSYYHQLGLPPLDVDTVGHLLDGVLGRDRSLAGLADRIVVRTGGNPFFVEEVVRSLVDHGELAGRPGAYRLVHPVDTLRVPATIQSTLAARIDRLAERDKALLQTAAVIGRNFTAPVLRLVCALSDEEFATSLAHLATAEFVQDMTDGPLEEYRFWHALTHEVAYDSLLRRRRAALHGAVAEAVIATEPERLDERSAVIALHFERAGDALEAARWNDRAGSWALRGDVVEAMRRWRAVIAHLGVAGESDDTRLLGVQVRSRLIRYGARTGMAPDEIDRLSVEGRALAERCGASAPMVAMRLAQATAFFQHGVTGKAAECAVDAARLAEEADLDVGIAAAAHLFVGIARCWTGPVPDGIEALSRVQALCGADPETGRLLLGYSPLARSHNFLAQLLGLAGRFEEAYREANRSVALCREDSDSEGIAWALSIYPRLARTTAEMEDALQHAEEAARIAEDSGNPFIHVLALSAVGAAEGALGRFAKAAITLERALAESRTRQVALSEEATLLSRLARAHLGGGDRQAAERTVDEAVQVARRQEAPVVQCHALITRALVHGTHRSQAIDFEADLQLAFGLAHRAGARAYEAEIDDERSRAGAGADRPLNAG